MTTAIKLIDDIISFIDSYDSTTLPTTVPSGPVSFRITYFALSGRAGPLRAAAVVSGLSFEQEIVSFDEHKQDKAEGKRRWSGLPELTVYDENGKVAAKIGHSNSILRYIGKLGDLYPTNNPLQQALIDEILNAVHDVGSILSPLWLARYYKNEEKAKKEEKIVCGDDKLPYWLNKYEMRLKENTKRGNKNGFIIGDKLSIADIKLFYQINGLCNTDQMGQDVANLVSKYPLLMKYKNKISNIDGFKRSDDGMNEIIKKYQETKQTIYQHEGKFVPITRKKVSLRVRYFPLYARGAAIRAAAAVGGISFEDEFQNFAEHGRDKADGKRRWGGLPEVLLYDENGKEAGKLGQSNAILRYIGKRCDLYPTNDPLRASLIDEALESMEDMTNMIGPYYVCLLFGQRKGMDQVLKTLNAPDKLPYWLNKFEMRLQENAKRGNNSGYFVGDKLTIADLKVYYQLRDMTHPDEFGNDFVGLLDKYPLLKKFMTIMDYNDALKKNNDRFNKIRKEYNETKRKIYKHDGKFVPVSRVPPRTKVSLTVRYFAIYARGAAVRATAAVGGISFEDEFVSFETHMADKAAGKRRWSGLPEVTLYDQNGKEATKMGQGNTIIRYLGKLTQLYPMKNPLQQSLCDEILESTEDVLMVMSPYYMSFFGGRKGMDQVLKTLNGPDKLPYWLNKFELRLQENAKRGNNSGYFVGDKLSVADIKVYYQLRDMTHPDEFGKDFVGLLDKYTLLKKFMAMMDDNDAIKKNNDTFNAIRKEHNESIINETKRKIFQHAGTFVATQNGRKKVSCTVRYFAMGGRGAPIRATAAIGGISYEDEFVDGSTLQKEKKEGKRRWSGLPEVTLYDKNGKESVTLGQGNTCIRYLGKLSGLYPTKNPLNMALIDGILDSVEDMIGIMRPYFMCVFFQQRKGIEEVMKALMAPDKVPYWVNKFEMRLQENVKRGNKNYFVGKELTVADIKVYYLINGMVDPNQKGEDFAGLLDKCPLLQKFINMMNNDDRIKQHNERFSEITKDNETTKRKIYQHDGKFVPVQ